LWQRKSSPSQFIRGVTPLEVARQVPVGILELVTFLHFLAELRLGYWYDGGACPRTQYPDLDSPASGLYGLGLELTRRCNLRCIHRYVESGPEASSEGLQAAELKRLIADAAALGCRKITYTGGEPLLAKELLLELIAYAREKGLHVTVFTNATLLTTDVLDSLARFDVRVHSSIYGPNEDVHDRITCTPGSFKAMTNNVLRLRARGIPVNMPVMLENQDYVEETKEFVRDRLDAEFKVSLIQPVGRGRLNPFVSSADAFLQRASTKLLSARANGELERIVWNRPDFPRVHRGDFARRLHKACWSGGLCVTPNGDVIPCAAARQLVVGNVRQSNLAAIVSSDAVQCLWGLTKDRVRVCRDCEYRYACTDCPVRVFGQTGSLYEKPPWCTYDPYVGEWQSDVSTVACSHLCLEGG